MKNTVYKNASIVTGLSVAERILGFLYRIVLSRYIGAEGLGLYQVSLSIFSLFLTLGTGGIPVTVSRMIAKSKAEGNARGEKSVLTSGLILALALSLPLALLLGTLGKNLPFLFSDPRSFEVFQILLLGLSFSCVYAVIRGYFWGNKKFLAASMIEMSEEIFMVLLGLSLLGGVTSPLDGAKRAAWSLALASLLSCAVAILCFFLSGGRLAEPKKDLKPLLNAAMPITSVRASGSLVNSAVAVLLPAMLLRAGFSEGDAIGLFGVVTGMVLPVLFIPATLIGSLALVLVPELSQDYYKKNEERLRKNIGRGLRFSFLIACALIPFFATLGREVGQIAFSSAVAGEMIARCCPILLPMSLTMISTSMLNSIGFEKQTLLFFLIGAAIMLLSILFLPAFCGIYAYVIGLGLNYAVTTVCNLLLLQKSCPFLFKRVGQVCVQLIFPATFALLPITLLGGLFKLLFKRIAGEILALLLTAGLIGISTLLLYLLLRLLPSPKKSKKL